MTGRPIPHLRLVECASPAPQRVEIRINAFNRGVPHCRSRIYRLRQRDLPELLRVAEQLEAAL